MSKDELQRLTDAIIGTVEKKWGPSVAARLSSAPLYSNVKEYVSTQCFALDFAMHLPGVPAGRIITIVGAEMSGKTTLAIHLIVETQRKGGIAVLLDGEYAFDKERAVAIGVDADQLVVVQPETIEDAVEQIKSIIKAVAARREATDKETLVTIVLDSVAALQTKAELEDAFGDVRPGGHARAISAAMRNLAYLVAKERIVLVIINQEKERIDFFGPKRGDAGKTMMGERPLGFHSSIILVCRQIEKLSDSKKRPIGIRMRVRVKKNKMKAPHSECEIINYFDTGIDDLASLLAVALQTGIVTKDKGWYKYESRKFQERHFAEVLEENPKILEELDALKSSLAAIDQAAEEGENDDD